MAASKWSGNPSGWITLSLNSGWTGTARVKLKADGTVVMSGSIGHATAPANQWNTPCTLPTGYAPSSTELFAIGGNTGTTMHAQVTTAGDVQMWTSAVTSSARGLAPIRYDLT